MYFYTDTHTQSQNGLSLLDKQFGKGGRLNSMCDPSKHANNNIEFACIRSDFIKPLGSIFISLALELIVEGLAIISPYSALTKIEHLQKITNIYSIGCIFINQDQ